MTNSQLKNRVKFCPAKTKKEASSTPTMTSRRDLNFVDMSDLESNGIGQDFFEFEEELSNMKAANKTTTAINDKDFQNKSAK